MSKKGTRLCKSCKKRFKALSNSHWCCSIECSLEFVRTQENKRQAKEWVKEKKQRIQKLKTWSDHYQDTLKIFNKYIRLRDKDKPCISCGASPGTYKITSGHYYPQGQYRGIALHEDNAHGQCWYNCNKNKHGNLAEYRHGLINRIGLEAVEELDRLRNETIKPSIPELIEMQVKLKDKIKHLQNK